jgi:hypothetical protein
MRSVRGAVVRHDALYFPNAVLAEEDEHATQEAGGRGGELVGQHLDVGQSGSVVDGDVDEFPAGTTGSNAPIAVDPVANSLDSAEFLMSR